MDNMEIYNAFRAVPETAQKTIGAGRLKGKTDINPMWRIKALTECFGPCGVGWTYTIDRQWVEPGANGEVAAFVNISLRVKIDGEWSEPIPGTGGSAFVENETKGPHTSDECYKMALTDAISVSCKALGFGADIYWSAGKTKYMTTEPENSFEKPPVCDECGRTLQTIKDKKMHTWTAAMLAEYSNAKFGRCLCPECQKIESKRQANDRAAG